MSAAERNALLFLCAVLLLGSGVRMVRASSVGPVPSHADVAALDAQIAAVDSAAGRPPRAKRPARSKTPPAPKPGPGWAGLTVRSNRQKTITTVDLDRATAQEIDALPGVGPSLARRIVEDREVCGPFGSLDGFQRVAGVGPALAERLRNHVTFSGVPRRGKTVFEQCSPAPRRTRSEKRNPRP